MATRTATPARERLSRDAIAAGALELADREGLDAVTIRRLAQDHGVTPMALYWHFTDKDAVIDGIAEKIFASVKLPELADEPWDVQLRADLVAILDAIRPHPKAADMLAPRIMNSEAGLELAERVIGMLREAGFSGPGAVQTSSFLLCSLITLVTSKPESSTDLKDEALDDVRRSKIARMTALSPRRFPVLLDNAQNFLVCASDEEYFANGVNFLVHGTRGTLAD